MGGGKLATAAAATAGAIGANWGKHQLYVDQSWLEISREWQKY